MAPVATMLLQVGAFLDYQALLQWVWRKRKYGVHRKEGTDHDVNDTLNKEVDLLEARLETFRRSAQLVQVRGFHFGKEDERLPHELLGEESEASSLQRDSWSSKGTYDTLLSSLHASDEGILAEAPDISSADRLWSFVRETAHGLWSKPPSVEQYPEPCGFTVTIVEPLTPSLRSLDVPCPSSITSYKQTSYFPETDTFFLPSVAGGPFEVPAAEAEIGRWIDVDPKKFWKFRVSALKELRETGKLHWRKVDRWGKTWQEGWWRGEERPVWDVETKKWDSDVVRC